MTVAHIQGGPCIELERSLPSEVAAISPFVDKLMVDPPYEIKGFSYFMAWHPRLTAEPAHAWFREQLRTAARTI